MFLKGVMVILKLLVALINDKLLLRSNFLCFIDCFVKNKLKC